MNGYVFYVYEWGRFRNTGSQTRTTITLLIGKFRRILTELSARDIFSFPDDNFSKCRGILTKLSICIDIEKIWFGIANRQISLIFDRAICPRHDNGGVLSLYVFINQAFQIDLLFLATCFTA